MRGENNIFLNGQSAATAPWIWKIISEGTPQRRDQIVDYHGNPIIKFDLPTKNYTPAQYRKTINMVHLAPLMLAALTEIVYNSEINALTIDPSLLQLIKDAGGPDLTQRETIIKQTPTVIEPTVVEPIVQQVVTHERPLG